MNEQIKRMQDAAKMNKELQKQLMDAGANLDRIVEVANRNGYPFTKADPESAVKMAKAAQKPGELSEKELEAATGGSFVTVTEAAVAQVVVSVEA